jgi:steroid delta-isomerase
MPTEAEMKDTLQACLEHWNNEDVDAITGLFADDAVLEDPYGTPAKEGREAIRIFFKAAFREFSAGGAKARLTLDTPIRGSHGNGAAMACTIDAGSVAIRIISVMRFDEAGRIVHAQGFWGPGDIVQPAPGDGGAPGAKDQDRFRPGLH